MPGSELVKVPSRSNSTESNFGRSISEWLCGDRFGFHNVVDCFAIAVLDQRALEARIGFQGRVQTGQVVVRHGGKEMMLEVIGNVMRIQHKTQNGIGGYDSACVAEPVVHIGD